jgi:hypothetical protein
LTGHSKKEEEGFIKFDFGFISEKNFSLCIWFSWIPYHHPNFHIGIYHFLWVFSCFVEFVIIVAVLPLPLVETIRLSI